MQNCLQYYDNIIETAEFLDGAKTVGFSFRGIFQLPWQKIKEIYGTLNWFSSGIDGLCFGSVYLNNICQYIQCKLIDSQDRSGDFKILTDKYLKHTELFEEEIIDSSWEELFDLEMSMVSYYILNDLPIQYTILNKISNLRSIELYFIVLQSTYKQYEYILKNKPLTYIYSENIINKILSEEILLKILSSIPDTIDVPEYIIPTDLTTGKLSEKSYVKILMRKNGIIPEKYNFDYTKIFSDGTPAIHLWLENLHKRILIPEEIIDACTGGIGPDKNTILMEYVGLYHQIPYTIEACMQVGHDPEVRNIRGETLAMMWISHCKSIPPLEYLHPPELKDYSGKTIEDIWKGRFPGYSIPNEIKLKEYIRVSKGCEHSSKFSIMCENSLYCEECVPKDKETKKIYWEEVCCLCRDELSTKKIALFTHCNHVTCYNCAIMAKKCPQTCGTLSDQSDEEDEEEPNNLTVVGEFARMILHGLNVIDIN